MQRKNNQMFKEKSMKVSSILLIMWFIALIFMIANHFNKENIRRMQKR